jgi:hypothetical protein
MYDYILVFLSTMIATAFATRWLYQEEKALEALKAKAQESKEAKAQEAKELKAQELKAQESKHAPQTPINIPTLSREKHDERTRLIEEWTIKYMQLVKQAEAQEPLALEPLEPLALEPLAQEKSTPESNAEHDAAIKAKKFPEREYIYSDSILPHERTPTHLTRSMQEWWEFERKHSAAPIGSWIHYENPKVQGETTIRVTYAILRIDAPERWQERVYFYHVGETCPF